MAKNKKKKEKIIYYDDNSTIVDMTSVVESRKRGKTTPKAEGGNSFKDKWKTYWSTVKLMFFPMCIALLAIAIVFLILLFIGS